MPVWGCLVLVLLGFAGDFIFRSEKLRADFPFPSLGASGRPGTSQAKVTAITKKNEAVDNVSKVVEVTSTKIAEVSQTAKVAAMDPKNQAWREEKQFTYGVVSEESGLVAPYCAIPRDYLSDTPLLRAIGFLVSQHSQKGAIPPSPFSERFPPLGEHAKWGCDTPPSKGASQ